MSRATEIFRQNDGEVTKAYYARLDSLGLLGRLATALFRAQKRSSAAKRYRGRAHKRAAYEVKNWSLGEVCRILALLDAERPGEFAWGWKRDPATPGFEHVLYVELPGGQVSFHSPERLAGPSFAGEWDGARLSEARILAFCDEVAGPDSAISRRGREIPAHAQERLALEARP